MFEKLMDAITQLIAGPRVADNLKDTLDAHEKANQSRQEVNQIIREAELLEKAKIHEEVNSKQG